MTTGANSNVRYEGTTFHVQTEDMGSVNAEIVTLVYIEGQILKTIRKTYAEIAGAETAVVRERVMAQHRTVIQGILRGRLQAPSGTPGTPAEKPSLVVNPLSDPRSGEQVSLLVLLRHDLSFRPIAGAEVRVRLATPGSDDIELLEAVTDAKGFTLAEATVPVTTEDGCLLVVEVGTPLGEARAELPVIPGRAALSAGASPGTEKPDLIVSDLGDPRAGEPSSFMVLLRGERSCRPVAGATVRLLFSEGEGEAVSIYEGTTDAKGYHLVEILLPRTGADEASAILRTESDLGISEVVLPVLVS